MTNIEMVIESVRSGQTSYQRVVILREKEGERYLPCWIGPAEADAIAVKMQGISVPRPLTHDFVCQVIDFLGGRVESAIIDKLKNNIFYAKLVVSVNDRQIQIDCRLSDALAVAIRKGVPIFADDKVLKKAGVLFHKETGNPPMSSSEELRARPKPATESLSALSESVQDILNTAETEAKRLNCSYVCTGHVLLALASETNTATEVIKNAGVNLAKIQLDIETLMREEHSIESGENGLTNAVKEAIRASITEAKRLGSEKVLPKHILLGLVRASDGIAARILKNVGIAQEMIYVELIRLYTGTSGWHEGQL